ncbi:unnamed protein product [Sphenostylis stenocarpa]|uniref:Uncharacterized protein n=1 Tax=Sphenostylis stenocarpa TaxID=92480 RepID=A0AA86TLP9_9FABA|nr:unnamed protein product [Sphenostylis stenocarpa]
MQIRHLLISWGLQLRAVLPISGCNEDFPDWCKWGGMFVEFGQKVKFVIVDLGLNDMGEGKFGVLWKRKWLL